MKKKKKEFRGERVEQTEGYRYRGESRVYEDEPQPDQVGVGTAGVGEGGPLVTGTSEAGKGSSVGEQPDEQPS